MLVFVVCYTECSVLTVSRRQTMSPHIFVLKGAFSISHLLKWSTTLKRTKGWTTTFSTAKSGMLIVKLHKF